VILVAFVAVAACGVQDRTDVAILAFDRPPTDGFSAVPDLTHIAKFAAPPIGMAAFALAVGEVDRAPNLPRGRFVLHFVLAVLVAARADAAQAVSSTFTDAVHLFFEF
jgi:hypothetical protein